MLLPPDHPQRLALADEVHARPPEPLETPSRATCIALLVAPTERTRELAHIAALCTASGVAPPAADTIQFSAAIGALRLKWERHGEFSTLTVFAPGSAEDGALVEPVAALLPAGWLAGLPGTTLVAAHVTLVRAEETPAAQAELLAAHFGNHIAVGGEVGEGAGMAFTDFHVHADGFARFLLCDRSFTPRHAGRMLQRLLEIEVYRMTALLALPIARQMSPQVLSIEQALTALTERIASERGDAADSSDGDEALLQELTRLAAQVEGLLTGSQFRFGACRAYHALVLARIAELRERRLPGLQTIGDFMPRRLNPAVETCATVERRLHQLSERVAQVSALLSTRVDIKRERQNQSLLASMDRRAKLQLRLQQTVEGLSLAAIVYYVVGLLGYLAKAVKAGGLDLDPDLAAGIALPLVALVVLLALRRARRRMHREDG